MSLSTVEPVELEDLLRKLHEVDELVTPPGSEAEYTTDAAEVSNGGTDASLTDERSAVERRAAWYQNLENAVLDLSKAIPRGTAEYEARKLFELLIELRRAIDEDPKAEDRDLNVDFATMQLADVVRRIERRLTEAELDDPRRAADFVFSLLRDIKVTDISRLLGVSTKTIASWKADKPVGRNADRVVLVAHLLELLRSSMTPTGLVMWFDVPREQLDGRTPLDVLNESVPLAQEKLMALARGTAAGQLAG